MEKTYNFARDGFIYLLSYATLLVSSLGMNFLLKGIINQYVPDALERVGFLNTSADLIGFLAAVIIAFPIFLYVNILANRMLGQGKMVHDTGVRRWLLYITLVVVILVIIWQLIALFIFYLNGTLVTRFLLHTLITLAIAVTVLGYQWWHLRFFSGESKKLSGGFRVFEWLVMAIVLVGVVWTFFIIDSPSVERMKRFDEARVNRLIGLSGSIQNFYGYDRVSGHQKLPASLQELVTDPKIFIEKDGLIDPVTKQQFEYRKLGVKNYELCAMFDTDNTKEAANLNQPISPMSVPKFEGSNAFIHPKGRKCFPLTVS